MYLWTPDGHTHTHTKCPPDLSLAHNYLASLTDRVRAEIDPRHWRLLTLYLPSKHTLMKEEGGRDFNPRHHNKYECESIGKAHCPSPIYNFSPFFPRGNIHAANKQQVWDGGWNTNASSNTFDFHILPRMEFTVCFHCFYKLHGFRWKFSQTIVLFVWKRCL